jgi:tetratricopeptide (TPR) repeat protein
MSRVFLILSLLTVAAAGLTGIGSGSPQSGSTGAKMAGQVSGGSETAPASFRFAKTSGDSSASGEEDAPIQLTASDGTGLHLVALEADGVLEPPLAFTELHLTFENPRDATIEGRFRIALPPGAALSRFAMKIGEAWQEGEMVERQRARQVYEDYLHRRQDPALLEQEAGNEFSARVFPIPARGRKELIVSYSHALSRADEPYVIPLHGLSQVGRLDLRVLLGGRPAAGAAVSNLGGEVSERRMVELHKQDWTPDRDFEIAQDRAAVRAGLRQDHFAVVRVTVPVEATEKSSQEIAGLYVLVDSSASRALGYTAQVKRLIELIAGLRDGAGRSTPLGLAAFDQEVVPLFEGQAGGFGAEEAQQLAARRPLGASDLHGALTWLADKLPRNGRQYPRVLLVTDGVATAGDTETRALKAAVHALGERGVERLDVLAVGGLRDEAVLRELVTGNLAHDGQRLDGSAPLAEIARRLTLASRSLEVAVNGAAWIWPETLDGVQPGDQALIYADLPADQLLRLSLDGRAAPLGELGTVEKPLLERAMAQAHIDRLVHLREATHAGDDDLRSALAREITALSVRHRVLSPFTALLVLESEYEYARFGLNQTALADILTVGPGGLDVVNRTRPGRRQETEAVAQERQKASPPPSPRAAPPAESDFDAFESEVEDGVEGGVEGGVPGGVVGGVAGGVVGGVPAGVAQPVEVPEMVAAPPPPPPADSRAANEVDEAPLRVASPAPRPEAPAPRISPRPDEVGADEETEEKATQAEPYTGRYAEVKKSLAAGRVEAARKLAESWSQEEPGDVLALLALGETWEAAGQKAAAARAYGSLIDLFPSRVDLRRLAGERLETLGDAGLGLAIDTYKKAVEDRPDHPTGHRLLAWALLRAGRYEEAFAALEKGLEQSYPGGRFAGLDRVLREDLGLLGAAWLRAEPARRAEVLDRLRAQGAELETEPSFRFVLSWETDANDVDLHVWDRQGGHAYYEHKTLPSGGELYADVTTGYGPECFTLRDPDPSASPYRLKVHYYSRGPMGYGMGTVQVIGHDGNGRFTIDPRPFVVMTDQAMVDLGLVGKGTGKSKK